MMASGRTSVTVSHRGPRCARLRPGASCSCRTSPAATRLGGRCEAAAANGADGDRDRHPVLRPGDGRARDPAGVAGGARRRGDARRRSSTRWPALDVGVPLAVMTYYNLVHHDGHERFAARLAAPASRCILPDLPLEEAGPWCEAADAPGVETVMLAAPTAPTTDCR